MKAPVAADRLTELKSKYEKNSARAERLALLILVGLAVEIVGVCVLGKSLLEAAITIVANLLIILGVWGELRFESRAREAGDGIVAEAEARSDEANAAAKKAQLELAKFTAPRALDEAVLLAGLETKPRWPVGEMLYIDTGDCAHLAVQISAALHQAGWAATTPKPIRGPNPGSEFPAEWIPVTASYGAQLIGVTVVAAQEFSDGSPQQTLIAALTKALSSQNANGGRDRSMRDATLRIVVAPKH